MSPGCHYLRRVDSDPGQFFCSMLLEVKTSEHPLPRHTFSDLFKVQVTQIFGFCFFHISNIWSLTEGLTEVSTKFFQLWLSPRMYKLTANIGIFSL